MRSSDAAPRRRLMFLLGIKPLFSGGSGCCMTVLGSSSSQLSGSELYKAVCGTSSTSRI